MSDIYLDLTIEQPMALEIVTEPELFVNPSSAITKGDKGDPGESKFRIFEFQFNNVTSQVLYTFQSDGYLVDIEIEITTVFDGAGAALSIGTNSDPQLLIANSEIDAGQLMSGGKISNRRFLSGEEIRLFINAGAGATQGAGRVVLEVT